jgi:sugar phosphate isomerase/epimerase
MNNEDRSKQIDRRGFLKTSGTLAAGMALADLGGVARAFGQQTNSASRIEKLALGLPNAEKLEWRVGVQLFTFRSFTLFESIDMVASLGLKYLETIPWQWVSKDEREPLNCNAPVRLRKLVKKKLADAGVKVTSCFKDAPFPKMFEFAKDMGMDMVISDLGDGAFGYHYDAVDKLCEEYGITIALTNHPKPSAYWSPAEVLKVCKGRSRWIAASGDIGHWMHEGFAPLDCVKKLGDRLVQLHFRDRDKKGPEGHDVPLGTGTADVKGMLTELYHHNIKPLFSLEYETNEHDPLPQLVESIKYIDKVAAELAAKR